MNKKNNNINIVIENNIFSKNKDNIKKPLKDNTVSKSANKGTEIIAPFQREPSFIADIRQAFSDKNMYGFKNRTEPPMYNPQGHPVYNHYYNTPYNATQEQDDEPVDEPVEQQPEQVEQQPEQVEQQPEQPEQVAEPNVIFDIDGAYVGPKNDPSKRSRHQETYNRIIDYINGAMYYTKGGIQRRIPKPQKNTIVKYSLQQYFPDIFPDYNGPV